MKNVVTIDILGTKYTIQCHPYEEGAELAWELQRLIGPHVLEYQKPAVQAMSELTSEQRKRMESAKGDELEKAYQELIVPHIDKQQHKLIEAAQSYLSSLHPKDLTRLSVELFRYVQLPDGGNLSDSATRNMYFQGNYKPVVPLMAAVIQVNDFLDLDASELLQVQATRTK
ncbi:MAG: hypothetical protein IV090_24645 [Candidatus Sericytochromatia bacterium]|nr:hypothetical protein [Candidatus Sericytochromatia bacterium]